jgi:hypothetical protein
MFLPGALGLPDLLIDFQQMSHVKMEVLKTEWERESSLDSPFAEALTAKFASYVSRLGTPDLDLEVVKSGLLQRYRVDEDDDKRVIPKK